MCCNPLFIKSGKMHIVIISYVNDDYDFCLIVFVILYTLHRECLGSVCFYHTPSKVSHYRLTDCH